MTDPRDILLFSYGTLLLESVQRSPFGRRLDGEPGAMTGYVRTMVEITDPGVLATSGERFHSIVDPCGVPSDGVTGTVFRITADELAAVDRHEVADYVRVQVRLTSGRDAWVCVKA